MNASEPQSPDLPSTPLINKNNAKEAENSLNMGASVDPLSARRGNGLGHGPALSAWIMQNRGPSSSVTMLLRCADLLSGSSRRTNIEPWQREGNSPQLPGVSLLIHEISRGLRYQDLGGFAEHRDAGGKVLNPAGACFPPCELQ